MTSSTLQPTFGAKELVLMFKIVCIDQNVERPQTIATGLHDEIEARDTVKDWIIRCYPIRNTMTATIAGGCLMAAASIASQFRIPPKCLTSAGRRSLSGDPAQ
jgi:hypothetical protein